MNRPVLPWAPIVIVLVGVAVATWLIFERGWAMWEAYLLLTLAAVGLCLLLLATLLLLVPREDWKEIAAVVAKTVRDDWHGLIALLRRR